MLNNRARAVALVLSVAPVIAPSIAVSSTLTQIVNPLTRPTANIDLSDLLLRDELGYDCIDEAQIDVAFHAAGKGARLPQTCLPEPCKEALSKARLASLIGRDPNEKEWDDYYTRYSEICRKETIAFNDAEDQPQDPDSFWIPILSASNPTVDGFIAGTGGTTTVATTGGNGGTGGGTTGSGTGPIIIGGGGGGGTTPTGPIIIGGGGGGGTEGGDGTTTPTEGGPEVSSGGGGSDGGDPDDSSGGGGSNLAVVPLPAGVWFALSWLAALGGLRLRRSRLRA